LLFFVSVEVILCKIAVKELPTNFRAHA